MNNVDIIEVRAGASGGALIGQIGALSLGFLPAIEKMNSHS
jgi:hypothetical protein